MKSVIRPLKYPTISAPPARSNVFKIEHILNAKSNIFNTKSSHIYYQLHHLTQLRLAVDSIYERDGDFADSHIKLLRTHDHLHLAANFHRKSAQQREEISPKTRRNQGHFKHVLLKNLHFRLKNGFVLILKRTWKTYPLEITTLTISSSFSFLYNLKLPVRSEPANTRAIAQRSF